MGSSASGGGGAQILRLNEEEMAAVNRLTEMGFDRTEAAQAYLACDKNEALAANLLMDGGFGGGLKLERCIIIFVPKFHKLFPSRRV